MFRHQNKHELPNRLSATLLQWRAADFAFRELAYALLCMAAGGQYMTAIEDNYIKEHSTYAFAYSQSFNEEKGREGRDRNYENRETPRHFPPDSSKELLSQLLSGSHLEGMSPGLAPQETIYWFNGALVILTSQLQDPNSLDHGLYQVVEHQQRARSTSLNAILISIEHVVLMRVFPSGEVEHTAAMPLFEIYQHASAGIRPTAPLLTKEERDSSYSMMWQSKRERERDREHHAQWLTRHTHTDGNPDTTFHALISFFDAIAREPMGSAKTQQGCLPTEIYALILQHVLDPCTRHACSQVSLTFHELCLQDFLVGYSLFLVPSQTMKTCTEASITPDYFITKDIETGRETRVAIVQDCDYNNFHTRTWRQQGLVRMVVGNEYDRKSLLPFSVRFRDLELGGPREALEPRVASKGRLGYKLQ
ncbi:MAG: hypothetical protein Q9226_002838 [Calogaya cf. arnoldii]